MDSLLRRIFSAMCYDFSELYPDVASDITDDVRNIRQRGCHLSDAPWMKRRIQLEKFFSRWTFAHEQSNEQDRVDRCFSKFMECQTVSIRSIPFRSRQVISLARRYTRELLGEYSAQEHYDSCRFSVNATLGSPRRRSDPSKKLKGLVSASPGHVEWLRSFDDVHMPQFKSYVADALEYTTVPKKWDIDRGIMPNTTTGSFYSSGLGSMIRRRLKKDGIYLNHLPEKHREWARLNSMNGKYATVDMSSASDRFFPHIVNALVPRKWYNVLKFGRLRSFSFQDRKYSLTSFMTMGIGFTFELQSLLFYSLLKSIRTLTNTRGFVSAYGDDLIFPSTMCPVVYGVLADIGMIVNTEKSYTYGFFRESCGGDFLAGIDVRPCSPKGCAKDVGVDAVDKLAFIYKVANNLLKHWSPYEIPHTLNVINVFIKSVTDDGVFVVPSDYPDFSGFCQVPDLTLKPVFISYDGKNKCHMLGFRADVQYIENEELFLREALRPISDTGTYEPKYPALFINKKGKPYIYGRGGKFVVLHKDPKLWFSFGQLNW